MEIKNTASTTERLGVDSDKKIEASIRQHTFEYGELLPEHPVQQFVERVASTIPRFADFPLKLIISPDWRTINACAYPDGTVIVGRGLLEFAKSEEELRGVIAHEYTHIYREHTETQKRKREEIDDVIQKGAKRKKIDTAVLKGHVVDLVGLMRLDEYEADLRGALELLDKCGSNPIAYKVFLQRLGERESEGGLVHGFSMDRALNIGTATYLYDLESIEAESKPIDPAVLNAFDTDQRFRSMAPLVRRPMSYARNVDDLARRQKARENCLENLETSDVPSGFSFLVDQAAQYFYKDAKVARDTSLVVDPSDQNVFSTLLKRMDETVFVKGGVPQEVAARRRLIHLALSRSRSELKILPVDKEDQKGNVTSYEWEKPKAPRPGMVFGLPAYEAMVREAPLFFSSPDGVREMAKALAFLIDEGAIPQNTEGIEFFADRIRMAAELAGTFGALENGEIDLAGAEQFFSEWLPLFDALAQKKESKWWKSGEYKQRTYKHFIQRLAGYPEKQELVKALLKEDTNESEVEAPQTNPEWKTTLDRAVKEIGDTFDPAKHEKLTQKLIDDFLRVFAEAPFSDVFGALQKFRYDLHGHQVLYQSRQAYKHGLSYGIYSPEYITVQMIEQYLSQSKRCSEMTLVEREAMFMGTLTRTDLHQVLIDIGYHGPGQAKKSAAYKKSMMTAEKRIVSWFDRDIGLKELKNEKDVLTIWRILFDHDDPRHITLSMADTKERSDNDERLVVHAMVAWFCNHTLDEVLSAIDQWRTEGMPAQEWLVKHSDITGPVQDIIVRSIQTGEFEKFSVTAQFKVADLVNNAFLRSRLHRLIKDKAWPQLQFEERLDVLFPPHGKSGIQDGMSKAAFFEEDIRTQDQYHLTKQRLVSIGERAAEDASRAAGIGVLMDLDLRHWDVSSFLRAMLKTGSGDAELKIALYEFVIDLHGPFDEDVMMEVDPNDQFDVKKSPVGVRVSESARMLEALYRTTDVAKHGLLRKLLVSEGGALRVPKKRQEFFEMIFKEMVQENQKEQDLLTVLRRVREALAADVEWELPFFAMEKSLREHMLVPPPKAKQVWFFDLYPVETDLEAETGIEGGSQKQLKIKKKEIAATTRTGTISKKMTDSPWRNFDLFLAHAEEGLEQGLKGLGYLEVQEQKRLSPLLFIKEFVGNMGAMGVRFLQNIRLVADMSDEYAREFDEVYDRMKGQSKFAALMLLEREWPECWGEIKSVEPSIGGGSIVTVYALKMKNGEEYVLKVRNPNVKYHVERMHTFAARLLDQMAKKYGGAYKTARILLDDIKEWVLSDISFEGFLEDDKEFRTTHQGFTNEGFDYTIHIPESRGPANKKFSLEKKIVGKNLTQWEALVKEGHDMKQVVSLLVKDYFLQVMHGQTLSDVHVGNLAVTEDKRVVIYDRNFFLHLSEDERSAIVGVLSPVGSPESATQALTAVMLENETGPERSRAETLIGLFVQAARDGQWLEAQRAIVNIKRIGVKIPLQFTLLLKNFQTLGSMARRAGFQGLAEAYGYAVDSHEK